MDIDSCQKQNKGELGGENHQALFDNVCYLICASDYQKFNIDLNKGDLVIAVDGGYETAKRNGIDVDICLGDFDSLGYTPENVKNVMTLPVEKDDTDLCAAVKIAWNKGYRKFIVYCALGGKRWDHTMANISLTAVVAKLGGTCYLVDAGSVITSVCNGSLQFSDECRGDIGLLSFSDVSDGVNIENLKYTLKNATLKNTDLLTVSNSFIGEKAIVNVKYGILTVFFTGSVSQVNRCDS